MGHRRDEMLISAGLKLHAIDAQITHPPKQTVAGGFGRLVGEG